METFFCHGTKKPEGRDKNSRDITHSCEVVPKRIMKPFLNKETRDKNPTRTLPDNSGRITSTTRLQKRKTPITLYGRNPPACAEIDINFTNNFGASSKILDTDNWRGKPLKFFQKDNMLDGAPCKNRFHQWEYYNRYGHRRRTYGRRSHLTNQPLEGLSWQVQHHMIQTARAARQPEIKNAQVHGTGWTLNRF